MADGWLPAIAPKHDAATSILPAHKLDLARDLTSQTDSFDLPAHLFSESSMRLRAYSVLIVETLPR